MTLEETIAGLRMEIDRADQRGDAYLDMVDVRILRSALQLLEQQGTVEVELTVDAEKMLKEIADRVLDDTEIEGKSIREWIPLILEEQEAQEPRVMTLEEVRGSLKQPIWKEVRSSHKDLYTG